MEKRGRILIAVAAVLAIGIIAWAFFGGRSVPPEPMYKGKPLSYWLQAYDPVSGGTNRPNPADADAAMYHAGTNAIPTLLRMVREEGSMKTRLLNWAYRIPYFRKYHPRRPSMEFLVVILGFHALHEDATPAIPELIKILNRNPGLGAMTCSMAVLGQMGPAAADAVPTLLRVATHTNRNVRMGALAALGEIHSDPDKVVPVLIAALHDPSAVNRAVAANSLARFGADAKPAVPALVQIILEPDGGSNSAPVFPGMTGSQNPTVRSLAKDALFPIDPVTYDKVVTNWAVDPALRTNLPWSSNGTRTTRR